jgi:ABC-type glycerol-3-phosphate transport system substrate-binding protein
LELVGEQVRLSGSSHRRRSRRGRWIVAIAALGAAAAVAGCGSSGGGRATLNWYHFPEMSGAFAGAAKSCSQKSGGRYTISEQVLPSDADGQRTQLVRRLAAEDSSIDIIGMDVIWTAEFAEAKWILPWRGAFKAQVVKGTLKGPLATAIYKGQLWGAPANSNTQLLWYRHDLTPTPPKTWIEMIAKARLLARQGKPHYIEIQGKQYEGYTVWFNTLLVSAGGRVLKTPDTVGLGPPAVRAAGIIRRVAKSPAADPSISNQQEDQNRLAFESGTAAFELNYPFVYPSAKQDVPKIYKQMRWAPYPSVIPGKPAKVTIGGLNLGVSAYSKHPTAAFQAAACLRDAANQKVAATKGGLPPTLNALYDDPAVKKAYPFADLIRRQINSPALRPVSPAYADISLAISKTLSPPSSVDPRSANSQLKTQIDKALSSGALL